MIDSNPRYKSVHRHVIGIVSVGLLLTLSPAYSAVAKDAVPAERTYFIVIMGLGDNGPYDVEAGCLTFDGSEFCTEDGETCLAWDRTQGGLQVRKQSGLSFTADLEEDGMLLQINGQGRVDDRGKKSALSAVGRAQVGEQIVNFSLAGREVRASRCLDLISDFVAGP